MINVRCKTLTIPFILMMIGSLSACSGLSKLRGALSDDGGVNYQNNQAVKQLEVPPDLTQPEFDNSFELPTGVVSAVSLKNGTANMSTNQVSANTSSTNGNVGDVRKGDLSSIKTLAGKTVLQINDTYPRSLVLTEIMLTRMGFQTVSKSSAGDVITVKYTGSDVAATDAQSTGFFSKFKNIVTFGSERRKLNSNQALISGKNYRATVSNEQGSAIVRFTRADGGSISDAGHAKIITLLNSAFNS